MIQYKIGETVGYVKDVRGTKQEKLRLVVTEVIFNRFDETLIDKYLIKFVQSDERCYDEVYFYPDIYKDIQAFIKELDYEWVRNFTQEVTVDLPIGTIRVMATLDSDYPGVWLDLIREDGTEQALIVCEYDKENGNLRALIYRDEAKEDYTHDIYFQFEQEKEGAVEEHPQSLVG